MTKTVPELVWGTEALQTMETTYGCVDCLLGGVESFQARLYMVSGTLLCATHALAARTTPGA